MIVPKTITVDNDVLSFSGRNILLTNDEEADRCALSCETFYQLIQSAFATQSIYLLVEINGDSPYVQYYNAQSYYSYKHFCLSKKKRLKDPLTGQPIVVEKVFGFKPTSSVVNGTVLHQVFYNNQPQKLYLSNSAVKKAAYVYFGELYYKRADAASEFTVAKELLKRVTLQGTDFATRLKVQAMQRDIRSIERNPLQSKRHRDEDVVVSPGKCTHLSSDE